MIVTIRDDFDRIARALESAHIADALPAHERALLDHMPASLDRALDAGCGDGALALVEIQRPGGRRVAASRALAAGVRLA